MYRCVCACGRACVQDRRKRRLIRGMQAHKNSTPLGIHTRRRVASPRCGAARPHLKRANKSCVTPGTSPHLRSSPLKSATGCSRIRVMRLQRELYAAECTVACGSEQASRAELRSKTNGTAPFVVFMPRTLKLKHWKVTHGLRRCNTHHSRQA